MLHGALAIFDSRHAAPATNHSAMDFAARQGLGGGPQAPAASPSVSHVLLAAPRHLQAIPVAAYGAFQKNPRALPVGSRVALYTSGQVVQGRLQTSGQCGLPLRAPPADARSTLSCLEGEAQQHRLQDAPVRGPLHVFCLTCADADGHFGDDRLAGHPKNLQALQDSGATVHVLRASCLCQGQRLADEGSVAELIGDLTRHFSARASEKGRDAAELARGLSHLRCLAAAAELTAEEEERRRPCAVVVIEAHACLSPGFVRGGGCWPHLLLEASASAGRGEDMLFFTSPSVPPPGQIPSAAAYSLSRKSCIALCNRWEKLAKGGVEAAEGLLGRFISAGGGLRTVGRLMVLPSTQHQQPAVGLRQLAPPALRVSEPRDAVKICIISLPHRADRRVDPLVCGPGAVAAMRGAGFEVDIIRASCYCERNALHQRGSLACYLGDGALNREGPQWIGMRRYQGAEIPVDLEEARQLRQAIDEHYEEGAERLVDDMNEEGTIEGYVVDTNWPGATSCAMSHARALLAAASDGYSHTLVFEDDAVIPRRVALQKGWCKGGCKGSMCHCASAWASCVQEAVDLARRAPQLDILYLGLGESFEKPGPAEGLLEAEGRPLRWLSRAIGNACALMGTHALTSGAEGITQIGYTWQAQAILYCRSALDDLLTLPLSEMIWAQDETIPHLYGRNPWNHRYMKALQQAGLQRRWVAGAPSDHVDLGWVYQLESLTADADNDLGLGTAWHSSNSAEL